MDRFHSLFDSQFVYALGWTIVHSFWQSLLVFMLLGISLFMSKRSRPEIRYWLSMTALICCLLISVKTFIYCYQDVVQASSILAQLHTTLDISQDHNWWVTTFKTINPWLDNIVLVWCIGFLVHIMLYGYDIILTQRLRHQSVSNLPEDWNKRLHGLAQKMGVTKQVSFMHSTMINVPSVIGHFKPIILLPLGILTQLPQGQIEAIMLHELAHVKRHDYLINILQSLVKVLFFFNPFVLAISKKIDIERENICDDLAVQACGDPFVFANSLSQFADVTPVSQSAMAASKDKYLLLARVKRLFSTQGTLSTSTERLIALFCAGLLGLTLNVNAKNQPLKVVAEPTTQQTTSLPQVTEKNVQPTVIDEDPVVDEPLTLTAPSLGHSDKVKNGVEKAIVAEPATVPKDKIEVSIPDKTAKKFIPLAEATKVSEEEKEATVQVETKPNQETVLLAQQKKGSSSSAALDYVGSENNLEVNKVSNQPQQDENLKGRVYANTDKFSSFSLESPNALDNIEQIIFAPISTSDTQFSQGARTLKNVVRQYFYEQQNQQPRIITLNNKAQASADFTGMNSSFIAQIRIKDVKLFGLWKGAKTGNSHTGGSRYYDTRTILQKRRDAQRVVNLQNSQNSSSNPDLDDINIPLYELQTAKRITSKTDLTETNLFLEVIAEIVFVDAINYEYAGYGLKKIWLDSANLEPDLLTLARHEGSPTNSRTQTERNADIIKNMWDILLSHLQNDVYQVASAIKNKELKLTSVTPLMDKPSLKNTPINRNFAQQYFRVEDSEFDEFIITAPDVLSDFQQVTYTPMLTKNVEVKSSRAQLKSKQSELGKISAINLLHTAQQNELAYDLAENRLINSGSIGLGSEHNLLVEIEAKSMEFYSRDANRTYRNATQGAKSSERGAAPFKGIDPILGNSNARQTSVAKPRAFTSQQYLRGEFDITLVDPQTHQILGYATTFIAIHPRHDIFKNVMEQIEGKDIQISTEDILLLSLLEKVKTDLHAQLLQIQHGDIDITPIKLSTQKTEQLLGASVAKTSENRNDFVARTPN